MSVHLVLFNFLKFFFRIKLNAAHKKALSFKLYRTKSLKDFFLNFQQTQAVGSTSTVTETGAMQVIIAPNAASAPVTTISCNWVSLP